jgi:hypothetical protein
MVDGSSSCLWEVGRLNKRYNQLTYELLPLDDTFQLATLIDNRDGNEIIVRHLLEGLCVGGARRDFMLTPSRELFERTPVATFDSVKETSPQRLDLH